VNLFNLAHTQLLREEKTDYTDSELLNRAISIRKWLDRHSHSIADKILAGDKVYHYGNKIKTYKGVK